MPSAELVIKAGMCIRSGVLVECGVYFGLEIFACFFPQLSSSSIVCVEIAWQHVLDKADCILHLIEIFLQSQNHGMIEPAFPFGSRVELLWALYFCPQVLRTLMEHGGIG